MNPIDEFYPVSRAIVQSPDAGMWMVSMVIKVNDHLTAAKSGNKESESRLINRLGQLRRCGPPFEKLPQDLQEGVRSAVAYLRSTGRTVNFAHPNPGMWITTRTGDPRF